MSDNNDKKVLDILKTYTNLNIISIDNSNDQHIITIGGTLKKDNVKKPKITLNMIWAMLLEMKEDITNINTRLDRIENRLDRIENCPTIKKELALQDN